MSKKKRIYVILFVNQILNLKFQYVENNLILNFIDFLEFIFYTLIV